MLSTAGRKSGGSGSGSRVACGREGLAVPTLALGCIGGAGRVAMLLSASRRESSSWLKEGSASVMLRTDSTSSSSSLELQRESDHVIVR